MTSSSLRLSLPTREDALPGRSKPLDIPREHAVLGTTLAPPYPENSELALFALGCFWGAERRFWREDGVWSTSVGYAGGATPNPTYEEVCSGGTGHAEAVRVVFLPEEVSYAQLLQIFWESHDPTQGMRQGNDIGTQYRSSVFAYGKRQESTAQASRAAYQAALDAAGHGAITTDILPAPEFFFAEGYHQQYLHKNPGGYCGLGGTGVSCPSGLSTHP